MTIEEKAEEYACYYMAFSQDTDIDVSASSDYSAFIAGARWMLEKAVKWLKENTQNYYEDDAIHDNCWYDDEQMIEDFQKSMEE